MRKPTYAFLTAAAFLALGTSPASALPIMFQDDFNTPGSADWVYGGAWSQLHEGITDNPFSANPNDFALLLRGDVGEASASQLSLSTSGFSNIRLSFDWAAAMRSDEYTDWSSQNSSTLFVEWRTGNGAWKTVYEIDLGGEGLGGRLAFTSEDVAFGPTADDLANIQFRFRTDGAALIDNVVLYDPPPENQVTALDVPNQVPEPATLLLFGAGLAAVGFARRKRKS